MLSLLKRSGFFKALTTTIPKRINIAGPDASVLRAQCEVYTHSTITLSTATTTTSIEEIYDGREYSSVDYRSKLSKEEMKQLSEIIQKLWSQEDISLVRKMLRAINQGDQSIGIAAPQLHVSKRMFIGAHHMLFADQESKELDKYNLEAYYNPIILDKSDQMAREAEGCLSFPGAYIIKNRPAEIRVQYMNILGETKIQDMKGLPARIFQHEIDHLDGVVMLDYKKLDTDCIAFTEVNMKEYIDEYGNIREQWR
jgi:peptide deformylase